MNLNNENNFIAECNKIVGINNVKYSTNFNYDFGSISGEQRKIKGIIYAISTKQVQKIVQIANKYIVSLHPVSTGKNWGLGSSLPVKDDAFILNLSGMNKIREVDSKFGYALIEPGVTQKQLYDYLVERKLPFIVDVTGSSQDTSILANTLECGVGYFSLRNEYASGFEVVLGNGDFLNTGYAHYKNTKLKYLYKYGVGPQLDGLFVQSNFGIVTALAIDLIRIKQKNVALTFTIKDPKKFLLLIDYLAELKRTGIINQIIKIGNKNRSYFTILPVAYQKLKEDYKEKIEVKQKIEKILSKMYGPWNAVVGVTGTNNQVKSIIKDVKSRLPNDIDIRVLSYKKLKILKFFGKLFNRISIIHYLNVLLEAMLPLYFLSRGVPTNSTLMSLYWPLGSVPKNYNDPDRTNSGMMAFLPIIPLDSIIVSKFVSTVGKIFSKHGFEPAITLNIISNKAIWGVIDLSYIRSNKNQLNSAKKAIKELYDLSIEMGIYPQRVGIDFMDTVVDKEDAYWIYVRKLKDIFDSNNIISPGRYNIK